MPCSPMRVLLPLLAALLLLQPATAFAQQVVVGPLTLDPVTLAEELELPGTGEAALLVIAGLGLTALEIGFEPIALDALHLSKNPPLLVRGLEEGLVGVAVKRGDQTWDGQLRLFGGRVTKLDVDAVLRAARSRTDGEAPTAPEFDLFAFYDAVDEAPDWADKVAVCANALASLDPEGPDHRMVQQSCARVEADKARADAEEQRVLLSADGLAMDLDAAAQEGPVSVGLVYRRDGRPRLSARGSGARWAMVGAGLLGTSIFTYSSLFWETQAQQEYLAYRDAERLGDTVAMSRHLFFTRSFDQRRDGSVIGASVFLTGTLSMLVVQAIEGARFREARRKLIGEARR